MYNWYTEQELITSLHKVLISVACYCFMMYRYFNREFTLINLYYIQCERDNDSYMQDIVLDTLCVYV